MADVDSYGQLVMSNGAICPLANAAQTEAAEEEILTAAAYVGSAQTAGTFVNETLGSSVVRRAGITCENDTTYAFCRSAGKIKFALPVSGLNGGYGLPGPLPYPKQMVSGDQIIVMANAASDRETALSVACTNGEYHVFSVTPSGASDTHEYVSILTGLGVGQTLVGRTISHAFAMGGNNAGNFISPVYFLNGSGTPIGSVTPNDPAVDTGTFEPCFVPVALNTRAVIGTDA